MAACPYDHYAHNIEHRYDQCREGDHDGTGGIVCNIRIVRCIADGEEYQNIAQCQAPRVTHEYFPPVISLSEDIVIEERHQHSKSRERQQGVYPHSVNQE